MTHSSGKNRRVEEFILVENEVKYDRSYILFHAFVRMVLSNVFITKSLNVRRITH
jgi:hypothetical protein